MVIQTLPTIEDIAKWPAPNYANPETRSALVFAVEIPITSFMVLFVCARFYTRTVMRKVLGYDDYVMGIAGVLAIAITALHCISASKPFGVVGYHIWDAPRELWSVTAKFCYFSYILFIPCVALTKLSICITYLRVFPSRANRIFCYGAIAFLCLWMVAFTGLNSFICWPIRSYWNFDIPGKCVNKELANLSGAVTNSITDFCVFLWPARLLWRIRIRRAQRIALIMVFAFGVVVCIAGIFRIWGLFVFFASYDVYWNGAMLYTIVGLEMNIGIICGCLPANTPILSHFMPGIFGRVKFDHNRGLSDMTVPEIITHSDAVISASHLDDSQRSVHRESYRQK